MAPLAVVEGDAGLRVPSNAESIKHFMSRQPIIVAHRGLHHVAPENSIRAFELAADAGCSWIECDVWNAADAVVVHHDGTLDRTTTGTGPVQGQSWNALSGLHLRMSDGSVDATSALPQLRDLVEAMQRRPSPPGILVEIKPLDTSELVREAVGILKTYSGAWILQSFDEQNLFHCLEVDATVPRAFLVENRPALERGIVSGIKDIHMWYGLLDEPTARRLHEAAISIGVWTVNAAQDMRRVIELGAQVIITDEPALAMEVVRG